MSDLYEEKNIAPMLIGASGEAFDSPDYIYAVSYTHLPCGSFP